MSAPRRRINPWETGAAAFLFLLGAGITLQGSGYPMGTVTRMGPGFFPVVSGLAIMLASAMIFLQERHADTPAPRLPLRPLLAITIGLVLFGALVERAGLVPAAFVLVMVSSVADNRMTFGRAVATATAVTALGYIVFVVGFRLPLDPFWW